MMTSVETVVRHTIEALNDCTMALRDPSGYFYHHYSHETSEDTDHNNSSDDEKNDLEGEGDDDYHYLFNNSDLHPNKNKSSSSFSSSNRLVHRRKSVKSEKSESQSSVRYSSRLDDGGEEQEEDSAESCEPECTICYRKLGAVEDDYCFKEYGILYNCQHSFCLFCIQRWLQQFAFENRKCPVCRCLSVFCVSSPRWLPHQSPAKEELRCCSPRWAMLQQLVRRCLSSLSALASLHIKLSCEAIKNLVSELVHGQEGLYHRHEITSIL